MPSLLKSFHLCPPVNPAVLRFFCSVCIFILVLLFPQLLFALPVILFFDCCERNVFLMPSALLISHIWMPCLGIPALFRHNMWLINCFPDQTFCLVSRRCSLMVTQGVEHWGYLVSLLPETFCEFGGRSPSQVYTRVLTILLQNACWLPLNF